MAVYKVPQDVEADDKLIGPFSFRQFIYLIVVAISIAGAWGLSQVFIPLAIVPLPIIVFFAALALPLRKDQPMETYLSAVISFYFLKSRKRFWQPDGINSFVTIIPPKDADKVLVKNLDEYEASRRLGYLAELVDSHGWSVRGAGVPAPENSIKADLYYESQRTVDMMDGNTAESQLLEQRLQASSLQRKQHAIEQMQNTAATPAVPDPSAPTILRAPQPGQPGVAVIMAPEPQGPSIEQELAGHKSVGERLIESDQRDAITYAKLITEEAEEERQTTSENQAAAVTIEHAKERAQQLAQRDDLTIQTLSEEANRLERQAKLSEGDEVTISLR